MLPALIFTVEHGDNKIPAEYVYLFEGQESVLASHRGHDPGAGELAVRFSTRFHAPCEHAEISRLLVDQNRSSHNRRALFSEYTRSLSAQEKRLILESYYWPYQNAVREQIAELQKGSRPVLHLAIHSFTPELRGEVRNCDVGLMYDPARSIEKSFSCKWQNAIHQQSPEIKVRRNYPYRGVSDGIVLSMRRQFPEEKYIGLQIEINQKYPFADREAWKRLQKTIVEGFSQAMEMV
jgi:predicted N-formylglutamate amidohydrolase